MSSDPFRGLRPAQIYELLIDPDNDLPTWPAQHFQRGYVSAQGQGAVRKTQHFIELLDQDGAFASGWRALDYGAGWGRIASLMLTKGSPSQLDMVDALDKTMHLMEAGGFENRCWKVSPVLRLGELPEDHYDFAYAFSIFTHLPPHVFANNLWHLARSATSNVYFTVRLPEFADHKFREESDRADKVKASLASEGLWFVPQANEEFGTMIVTEERLRSMAAEASGKSLDYLGQLPGQMQHLYAMRV